MPLLTLRGIRKRFGRLEVLHGVDLDLVAGEVLVLAGANGAGKSTLVKILAGVYDDWEGEIALDGARVRPRSPHDAARLGIACIHQELALVGPMSVADNLFLGRERCRPWGVTVMRWSLLRRCPSRQNRCAGWSWTRICPRTGSPRQPRARRL